MRSSPGMRRFVVAPMFVSNWSRRKPGPGTHGHRSPGQSAVGLIRSRGQIYDRLRAASFATIHTIEFRPPSLPNFGSRRLRSSQLKMVCVEAPLRPPEVHGTWRAGTGGGTAEGLAYGSAARVPREHGGGAGNRTRVRRASNSPSSTCVVTVSPVTGSADSAATYPSLVSVTVSRAPSRDPALVVGNLGVLGRPSPRPAIDGS